MTQRGDSPPPVGPLTQFVRAGRDKALTGPFVNPPVVHASTVLFDSVDAMLGRRQRYVYGRRGTPTSEALETAVSEIEGAAGTVLCPSGLSAASTAILSSLSTATRRSSSTASTARSATSPTPSSAGSASPSPTSIPPHRRRPSPG